ncbi:hypothetical protein GCM10008090_24540 [Arenicella chitinivorans]|uniref:Uncharacterized protein n=1 Tax=Arenicella chitinivorans TaxID=1329800 RepID=A0A918RYP1_9GAMM|nr:hypothetical protein [Arenicella chitinivorans]GHA13863.1 hypothetical protein GCM10008090_24540 [Arenicella chitinivorans]
MLGMHVRFVVQNVDIESGRRQGVFQAMSDLEYAGSLLPHEQSSYDDIYEWFRYNLKKPTSFSRSTKPHSKNVALSWFKDSATEHIAKLRELVVILDHHGLQTAMLRTERPGYIVYEDPHQVAAEPFNDTET